MLDELLKLSKSHSTVVIAALAAIVIAGSLAGGLWIQSLQSSLEQRDKIHDERVQQLTEAHAQELAEMSRNLGRSREANGLLAAQFKMVEEKAGVLAPLDDTLTKAINGLDPPAGRTKTAGLLRVRKANDALGAAVASTTHALERAHDASAMMETVDNPTPVLVAKSVSYASQRVTHWPIVIAAAVLGVGMLVLMAVGLSIPMRAYLSGRRPA